MNALQLVIAWLGTALLFCALLGLLVRGSFKECYAFSLYVAAVLVPQALALLRPERFQTYDFWVMKEVLHSALKFAVALELGFRILRGFPGALATGRRLGLVVVSVVYLLIVSVPGGQDAEFAAQVLPRVLNGTIWLLVALAALVLWYRLPIRPLHKAILLGFVPYLLVFSVAETVLATFGWGLLSFMSYAHTIAYVVLEAYWVYAIWRPEARRA